MKKVRTFTQHLNQRVKKILFHPINTRTKDDDKFKPQIFKFSDFTKGSMNYFFIARAKSFHWVMIVLYYMLDTARVNSKTVWCITYQKEFCWH